MQVFHNIDDSRLTPDQSIVTLGNFDGIHLGHQALIGGAVREAKGLGIPSVVLTFEPHPLKVLAPERAPPMLLCQKDKIELLRDLEVDFVVIQGFNLSFARLSAEEFVRRTLVERLRAQKIWVGRDLRFGEGRRGSVGNLLDWGKGFGFQVRVVEPVMIASERVSSSRIRQLIGEGKVQDVQPMLGRYHFVSGRVVAGNRRGRELGFPTANISTLTEVLPADGIYATLFQLGDKQFLSVSSVGKNPTFGEGPRTVESYIMNFRDDIYGQSIRLLFVQKIREEEKFSSVEDLIARIRVDIDSAEAIFRQLNFAS